MNTEQNPYITVKIAAEVFHITERKIRNWMRTGKVRKYETDSGVRVHIHELADVVYERV